MAYTIMVAETRTGRRITQIPVSGGTFSAVHRTGGDITVQIPLLASEFRRYERVLTPVPPGPDVPVWRPGDGMRAEFLAAVDPVRCMLAVLDGDNVIEAGPIWWHTLDQGSSSLTVRAAGEWSIFDHRRVMGVVADGVAAAAWSQTYSALSLATIAKRLIQLLMTHTGGNLPIVLPDDETAADDADHTRTYEGPDLGVAGERIRQLMSVEGGPDIAFEPRLTADRGGIEFVMRTGTEADPMLHQHSGDWIWDAQVPRGQVHGIGVAVDATGVASRSWLTGEGMAASLLMEFADDPTLTSANWPLLETVEARSTVTERATAASWARSNLAAHSRAWSTWTVDVLASSLTRNGTLVRPGDWGRLWVPRSHPYLGWKLAEGYYRTRLLKVSGSLDSRMVRLDLAPTMDQR